MPSSTASNLGRSLLVGLIVAATALIAFLPLYLTGVDSVESTTNDVRKGIIERSADNVDAFFRRARGTADAVSLTSSHGFLDFNGMYQREPYQRLVSYLYSAISKANGTINNAYMKMSNEYCWGLTVDARGSQGANAIVVVHSLNCTAIRIETHDIIAFNETKYRTDFGTRNFPIPYPPITDEFSIALSEPRWFAPYFSFGDVALDYAVPLYNTSGAPVGIYGVSALPKDISSFLRSIGLRPAGRAVVLEAANGTMLANSWGQPNAVTRGTNFLGEPTGDLLQIGDIADSLMQRVIAHYGRDSILRGAVPFAATMGKGRDRTYVDVLGVTDAFGLDLRILVAMPLEDFLGDFNDATTTVVAVIVPIVLLIVLLAVAVAAMSQYALLRRNKLAPKAAPLTLLFTDIEGSTTLWNQSPEAMGKAIDIHHRTIRQAIAAHGAYEVKTVGDAFMIATGSALTATGLALDIQADLTKQEWPGELTADAGSREWNGLRVRIAVHRCVEVEAKYEEDKHYWDYYGNDVNIAARIEGKAAGGQILMAESTWNEVQSDPLCNVTSVASCIPFARGVHLKGVDGTVLLYSLVPASLAARAFQPLPGHEFDFGEDAIEEVEESSECSSGSDVSAGTEGTTPGLSAVAVLHALTATMSPETSERFVAMLTIEMQLRPHKNQRKSLRLIAREAVKRMNVQQNFIGLAAPVSAALPGSVVVDGQSTNTPGGAHGTGAIRWRDDSVENSVENSMGRASLYSMKTEQPSAPGTVETS